MALRLTDPVGPSAASSTPSAPVAAPAVLLFARAQRLIATGDLPGYRRLFAEAAEIEDVHRRYEARMRLLEAGLGVKGRTPAAVGPAFAAVADAALRLLDAEPREPAVVNVAGIALYELGELTAAERLFAAAGRLDPELPHTQANLAEIARRRSAGLDGPLPLPSGVRARLKDLRDRGRRAADRARPATGLTLSLCMIVKDEEAMLGQCLAAVRDHVDEIVVVDTGSTDRTIEIAREFGATVLEREWIGDFSAARNVSFDAAAGDWLLFLDADEVLVDGDGPRLRELCGRTWREAFYVTETNHTGNLEDGTAVTHNALRLFRNRPEYRFEGRIHEQIAHRLPGFLPERFESTNVRIEHYGYLGAVRDAKEKSRRNIELLERQVAEGLDSPFLHFNLGSEHAAAGDSEAALAAFTKAWDMVRDDPAKTAYGFLPSLSSRLIKAMRLCGQDAAALARGEEVLAFLPGFTDVVFEQALAARALGDGDRAAELLETCLEWGDAPSGYSATVGCGTFLALSALGDLRREQGRLDDAEPLLHRALVEHPRFLGTVDPLAATMLARCADPATVVTTVHGAFDHVTPAARFMLALALYEAKAVQEAEVELRAVLDAQPDAAVPRLALAEALLSQRRYAEAADEALMVDAAAACAADAARSAAFARLAAGDATGAARVLDHARTVGLPAGEVALLDAWRAGLAGEAGSGPAPLPAAATEPLMTMLEALLRVTDVDAFATLVGLVDALPLADRERRERLARLYLRRGFLESAADEWIAVVREGPADADALAGLGWVAVGRALPEDALLFAQEALSLDPGHPAALRILERVHG
ncbi:glycosyltransferase [Capillimicrobium parvum]|nr:glycosyltransferase [Capillimicrobium parvum]